MSDGPEPARPARPGASGLVAGLWLAPPVATGAGLRLWGLGHQIFLGDEVHGIEAALTLPLREVFQYRAVDHCIPLAALYRLLAWLGVGLSETVLRFPSVLAGLLALLVLPLVAARWGGVRVAAALAWLLALSPELAYYGRIARPYALVVLLGALAAMAFWRWYRGSGHRFAAAYAGCAAVSVWLHPGSLPFVAAPLAFAAGEGLWGRAVRRRTPGRSAAELAVVGSGLALGLALFLVPARRSLARVLELKAGRESLTLEAAGDLLLLGAGSARPAVALLFWAAALAGLAVLARRRPAFAAYGAFLVAAQWLAVALVLRPQMVARPIVSSRYLLVALPVVLLWVACGLAEAWERVGRRRRLAGPAAPAAFLALLVLTGPYVADPWLRFGPFAASHAAAGFHEAAPALPEAWIPEVYRLLAREPGRGPVAEAPATTVSSYLDSLVALSRVHGRPVVLGTRRSWLDDPGSALRTLVAERPGALCRRRFRFVVVHGDRSRLERAVDNLRRGRPPPRPAPPGRWFPEAESVAGGLGERCGEPLVVSAGIRVWDPARAIRAPTGRSPGS